MDIRICSGPSREVKNPVLVFVDGANDIEFFRRISRVVHIDSGFGFDLAQAEEEGRVIFIPRGGSDHSLWTDRLLPLRLSEVHLFERDGPELAHARQQSTTEVVKREGCIAFLTAKRTLENYLHPAAIEAAGGPRVEFGDYDDVPTLIAVAQSAIRSGPLVWPRLMKGKRRKFISRVKRWLNTVVVYHMSAELLAERDPAGEIKEWLTAVARLTS